MSTNKKMIMLKASDGVTFEIEEAVAVQSITIGHLIEDGCANTEIPLDNVTGPILSKVIEYCKKHVGVDTETATDEVKADLTKWDAEFIMEMEQSMILDVILAANYLNVKGLLDLSCQTIADRISACKSAEEVRETFGIENDFTAEEEEEVRKENQWAFVDAN